MSGKTSKLIYVQGAALLTVILGLSGDALAGTATGQKPAQIQSLPLIQSDSDNASSQNPGRAVIEDEKLDRDRVR